MVGMEVIAILGVRARKKSGMDGEGLVSVSRAVVSVGELLVSVWNFEF